MCITAERTDQACSHIRLRQIISCKVCHGRQAKAPVNASLHATQQPKDHLKYAPACSFGGHPAFLGVDMLNEPSAEIPTTTLQKYYTDTYNTVRAHSDCILVHAPILQTQQMPGAAGNWESFMPPPQYINVWHTWHLYYAYDGDANSAISSGVPADSQKIQQWSGNYLLIGEWSLATRTAASSAQVDCCIPARVLSHARPCLCTESRIG